MLSRSPALISRPVLYLYCILPPVHVTTQECTGDTTKAVMLGVDVVAYRSLSVGQHAVHGLKEYSSVYGQYLFYFSSLENKLVFEVGGPPAWIFTTNMFFALHVSLVFVPSKL